jgi:hypothetical protein
VYVHNIAVTETKPSTSQALKVGTHILFVSPQIANLQILGLIPQSQSQISEVCQSANDKFVMINPQVANQQISLVYQQHIANPQICKEKSSVSDPCPQWFAFNIFLPK